MSEQQIQALIVRALKTFVQVFLGVFVLGLTPVIATILSTNSFSGAKSALLALVTGGVAAGISAVMNVYIKPLEAK